MNKGLKAWELYQGCVEQECDDYGAKETIEKSLKALEIIKSKSVNVKNLIIYCFEFKDTYEDYVDVFNYGDNYWDLGRELLTKEEFNLLKEVLLWNTHIYIAQ